jgi:hypothetical protein
MMRLLPMKRTGSRRGEPVVSLLFGVPSLTIASGTLLVLLLDLVVGFIGPPRFYQVVLVRVEETARSGRVVYAPSVSEPSIPLVCRLRMSHLDQTPALPRLMTAARPKNARPPTIQSNPTRTLRNPL